MAPQLIEDPKDLKGTYDVCVIGSGAGGSVVAHHLAESGKEVIVLEQGGLYTEEWIRRETEEGLLKLWKASGEQLSQNFSVNIAQAECVGGGTTINWGVCFNTPDPVLDYWRERFGFPYSRPEMETAFGKVRRVLRVQQVTNPGRAHEIVERGVRALGYHGGWMERNSDGGVKQSMMVSYLREAPSSRLSLVPNFRVTGILRSNGKTAGVRGIWSHPAGHKSAKTELRCKIVILSAGAIASSAFLLQNRLGNRNGQVGRHLSIHPGAGVLGEFDEEINRGTHFPMAFFCDEFAARHIGRPGFVIESTVLPPFQFALDVPRFGDDHTAIMKRYSHFVLAGVLVHDEPSGTVRVNWSEEPVVDYALTPGDQEKMIQGMEEATRILLAAGAVRVITPHFSPLEIRRNADIPAIRARGMGPGTIASATPHPQGGNRMGGNPLYCVVDIHCQVNGVPGLFVCDASVFPTAVGVNPQLTVMAIADRTAQHIVDNSEGYFA